MRTREEGEPLLTLHGVWLPNQMFLYATEGSSPAPDPFPWLQSLRQLGVQLYAHQMVQRSLYLPSMTADGVLRGGGVERLSPRAILGVNLPPSMALQIQLRLVDVSEPYTLTMRRIVAGPDIQYWQAVSAFALDLLRRGQYAPGIRSQHSGSQYFGESAPIWSASLYTKEDNERFEWLAETMPPACRNFAERDGGAWYGLPPAELLQAVLNQAIDAFIRDTLYPNDGFEERPDMSAGPPMAVMSTGRRRQFDQWYDGLFAPAPIRTYSAVKDAQLLQDLISRWTMPVPASASVLLGFRLEEPPETDDTQSGWQLTLFLQAAQDPSLTISASDLASMKGRQTVLGDVTVALAQTALQEQWRAATHLYSAMTRYANPGVPLGNPVHPLGPLTEWTLSIEQAYGFLKDGAPVLTEAGFVVQLPSFWTSQGRRRVRLQLQVKNDRVSEPQGPTRFGLSQWMGFNAAASLGDATVSMAELEEMAAAKVPLVQVRGQWTEVSEKELQEAVRFLEQHNGKISLWELIEKITERGPSAGRDIVSADVTGEAVGANVGNRADEVGEADDADDGPALLFRIPEELERFIRSEWVPESLPVPDGFRGELRPYQQVGFSWMSALTDMGVGACLADDMGLGKTIQVIALLCRLYDRAGSHTGAHTGASVAKYKGDHTYNPEARPTLILCPTSLLGNWQHELNRFSPGLRVLVHHGGNRTGGATFADEVQQYDVILTTYTLALRDETDLSQIDFAVMVIDEAQQIKNSASKQARAVYRIADANQGPLRRIALSGTPVENRLAELWAVFRFIAPGYLGSRERFRDRFANPIERHADPDKSAWLRRLIAPMVLRRVKTDTSIISDLPEKIEAKEYCALTKEQASLYKATVDNVLLQVESLGGMARRGLILASLTRLKQICNHPALFLHDGSRLEGRSGKLQRITELVREIHEYGEAALVFTQYREMGELLVRHLSRVLKQTPLFLHGGIPKGERDKMIEQFQDPSGPSIFILSIRAGGVGLNLTRASHVIHYDRWWNPAVENQATDRAFRIGQTQTVEVHKFVCQGTLEERIDELMEDKRALANQIIGSGENWLTELPDDELASLFTLREEVLGTGGRR